MTNTQPSSPTSTQPSAKTWHAAYPKRVPKMLSYPDIGVYDFLSSAAQQFGENIAINFVARLVMGGRIPLGSKLNFEQLLSQTDRLAASLARLGIKPADRVVLLLPNSPQFVVAFFALMRLGAVAVPVPMDISAAALRHILQDCGAASIVLLNTVLPTLQAAKTQAAIKRTVVTHLHDMVSGLAKDQVRNLIKKEAGWVDVKRELHTHLFTDLVSYSGQPPPVDVGKHTVAVLRYDVDGHGTPLTHRNLISNVVQLVYWGNATYKDVLVTAAAFADSVGLITGVLYGVASAIEHVMVPADNGVDLAKALGAVRCTLMHGTHAEYQKLLLSSEIKTVVKGLKHGLSIANSAGANLNARFAELTGRTLYEGLAPQRLGVVTHCNPIGGEARAGVGLPLPDTDAQLDAKGELLVSGPQTLAYTPKSIDGTVWVHTGCSATADEQGYFRITS
jgi:long-chain acyl-CoA synthetase